ENSRSERTGGELHRELACLILTVEHWIHLDDVERGQQAGLRHELEGEVRFAIAQPSAHRRTDAGCDVWIDDVHVETDVNEASASHMRERFSYRTLDAEAVDLAHREHLCVERAEQLAFSVVERPHTDQRDASGLDRRQIPAVYEA